jgi:hypothetical protein
MGYKVIDPFKDVEDGNYLYPKVGEKYPREGYEPSEERIKALSSTNNRKGKPFIAYEEDPEAPENSEEDVFPKHTGGGYYELSNGEKVKGKEAAEKAENELKVD